MKRKLRAPAAYSWPYGQLVILMKTRETNLVDEALISLDELIIHRVVVGRKRSERVSHVVDTKEECEKAIGSSPWDFAVIDVGVQKLMFDLILKGLHSRSKARLDNRVVDCGSTIA